MTKAIKLLNRMSKAIILRERKSLKLSDKESDGRSNSIVHERNIVKFLRDSGFGTEDFLWSDDLKASDGKTKNRHWWDILLFPNSPNPIPVNIKSTAMQSADNACNFMALKYCYSNDFDCTEFYSSAHKRNDMCALQKSMKEGTIEKVNSDKDYYFLVANKNNLENVIVSSIKTINQAAIKINANNLPFQVEWRRSANSDGSCSLNEFSFYAAIIKDTVKKLEYIKDFGDACEHYTK